VPATIDDALAILEDTGPEFAGGLSNHGPMAAEALVALGRDDAVVPWVERYRQRLQEHPSARNAIDGAAWREALGRGERAGDWIAFFQRQLAEAPWPQVLDIWVERLAPGIIASATHGVIRTGHAARALSQEQTPLRLHELAEGLGYWASRYALLPGTPSPAGGSLRPSQAVTRVELLPEEQRFARVGTITAGLAGLQEFPQFAATIDLVDTSGDASAVLSDLTETFARVYLANNRLVIHFIHSVTGPSAVRLLAPHVKEKTAALALRYAWQAAAALYAAFATAGPASVEPQPFDWEDIIDQAVATGDEHAIKFADACLREHRLNPSPAFPAAAKNAAQLLTRAKR
jgi:hypothetical protein